MELPFEFDEKGHTISDEEPLPETNSSDFENKIDKALAYNWKEEEEEQ